jgi:chitin disaccharide deacetylase
MKKEMFMRKLMIYVLLVAMFIISCSKEDEEMILLEHKKMLILNMDDIGMCAEANLAAQLYIEEGTVLSGSVMMPCNYADEFIEWAKKHPKVNLGVHLTLNSEWRNLRWGPLADREKVPSLLDYDGFFWNNVFQVATNAKPQEVETEIRAQIDKMISLGLQPSHIDTHMGSLYSSHALLEVFIKVAMEYQIPANIIDIANPKVFEVYRSEGYPVDTKAASLLQDYTLPRLDYFTGIPGASSYEEKREKFFRMIDKLEPGLTKIVFHPSVESESLKSITNSWQQRVWEAELFFDPEVIRYMKDNDVVITTWREVMKNHKK